MPSYSQEPEDRLAFTQSFNAFYTRFAGLYDLAVKLLPVWKTWLRHALPELRGSRLLEVSFGTGYLLTQYAGRFEAHGLEYNRRMIATARSNLGAADVAASLIHGTVDALPYRSAAFDCVLSTMAFSGYPDGAAAMEEMARVLRPGGRLVIIDVNYPSDANPIGSWLASVWKLTGDLIRDMGTLFESSGFDYRDREIGGRGSIRLYVADKTGQAASVR